MEKAIMEKRIDTAGKNKARNISDITPYKVDVNSLYKTDVNGKHSFDEKTIKTIQKDLKKTFSSGNQMLLAVTLAQPMSFDELEKLNQIFSGKEKSASRVNGFVNASKTDDGVAHARKGYNTITERVSDDKGTVTTYVTRKA